MYVADGVGGAVNSVANMDAMSRNMKSLTALASSGGFAVSAEGGQALLNAINQMKDAVMDSRQDVEYLKQAVRLGTSPDARVITAYNQKVAADSDGQSFLEALQQLDGVLDEAEAAIKQAMANYENVEASNQRAFNG
ncbi:hypothetical protein [Goodfellowiella coeruleoviolacea]|uniref:Uncharacterized protein n=1 Tax=Goodfellowiella coeruleoviolacea TaxID=334858 RepID=A0AAE3GH89_9PSEU|nr:hypothetical protein [Goodfellowiella coeruleoviolacea]MCP2166093.1 hypothetical protein [Goodfellowiella coeruleoviolacea]